MPSGLPLPRPMHTVKPALAQRSAVHQYCHLPMLLLTAAFAGQSWKVLELVQVLDFTCWLLDAGEAPPRPDHVPQAAGHRHWAAVREVRRQVRGVRQLCAAGDAGPRVRRVQLRLVRGALRHLRRHRHLRRVLLQGAELG